MAKFPLQSPRHSLSSASIHYVVPHFLVPGTAIVIVADVEDFAQGAWHHSDHSDPEKHPYRSHVFWSDDHGATWQLGGVHEDRTNESAVVELADGSILQAMRSYHGKNRRAMSRSRGS